jgi:hypothetical protein
VSNEVAQVSARSRADVDLAEEIELYLAEEIEENIARGMSPDEARRRAYLKFGSPQQVRESVWQQNSVTLIDSAWRDLKYAARTLSRSPGFTLVAVLVMALGIGANIALFTVVRCVLLNPLPYRGPSQLVSLFEQSSDHTDPNPYVPVDAGSFAEWQSSAAGAAKLAMVSPWQQYNVSAEGGKLPEQIDAAWCSWNFSPRLGSRLRLGERLRATTTDPAPRLPSSSRPAFGSGDIAAIQPSWARKSGWMPSPTRSSE